MAKAMKPAAAEPRPAPDRWWRRHLTAVVVVMAVLATGAAYASRPSDASQIAALVQQLQQGVEREDAASVAGVLSPGYVDNFGCDQRGALTFLQEWLWRPGTVQVTVESQELAFHTRHRAMLTATVRLTGTRQPQGPFNDVYVLNFDLRREAVAIFSAAEWRRLLTGGPVGWRVVSVRAAERQAGTNT